MQQGLIFEENLYTMSVCSICKREIDDSIYRIVIFQDKEKSPIVKKFHFFFPCWDMEHVCQEYKDYKMINLAFSCEKTILNNPQKVRNLQRNFSLWE